RRHYLGEGSLCRVLALGEYAVDRVAAREDAFELAVLRGDQHCAGVLGAHALASLLNAHARRKDDRVPRADEIGEFPHGGAPFVEVKVQLARKRSLISLSAAAPGQF